MDLPASNAAPDAISRRAYEIWEREGCPEGCDMRHWLQAEEELRTERNGASQPQPATMPSRNSDVTPLQGTRAAAAATKSGATREGGKRGGSATPFGAEKNGQSGRRKAATPAL